jgi:hypothetical protein
MMTENTGEGSLNGGIGPAILEAIKGLKGAIAALEGKINAWPDLHFLQAAAQRQVSEAREGRDHRQRVEIKLDEIYTSMATSSEIAKLREDVNKSLNREDALDLRMATIESRLGIKNPLVPE